MDDAFYSKTFFSEIDAGSGQSALAAAPVILSVVADPKSVVDVGCGVGSWLAAFEKEGITDYLGIDGDYVVRSQLRIPEEKFRAADLTQPISLDRKFDLAICLEVGEHLPTAAAGVLVDSLVKLSDIVVFSAAIPFQGGVYHVNEQWPTFWADLFASRGFVCFDCFRPTLWDNTQVGWWFAQNMLLFCRESAVPRLKPGPDGQPLRPGRPLAIVHPRYFLRASEALTQMRELQASPRVPWALRALGKSVTASLRHRFGKPNASSPDNPFNG